MGSGNLLRFAAFVVIGWELGSQVTKEILVSVVHLIRVVTVLLTAPMVARLVGS